MIMHGDTLLSEDIIEEQFVCNLGACKGACCVEGDYGAPLAKSEAKLIKKHLPKIAPYMTAEALADVERKGVYERDRDGDWVTTCQPSGACNFSFVEDGVIKCAIERAEAQGAIHFQKPMSCHLYPIRIKRVGEYEALNYDRWDICKPACSNGASLKVPVYRFLKDALTRKYGESWYQELEQIAEDYTQAARS